MIRLIMNNIKLLMKKKSYILMGIVLPAFIIVFFSFEFGASYKYKVGVIDKDNSYASKEIIKTIDDLEDIESIKVKETDYKILLTTQQIEMVIIINDDFQNKLLNGNDEEIIMKSIKNSHIVQVVKAMINLKCEDLSMISSLSNKDKNKFKEIIMEYNDESTKLSLNDVCEVGPSIKKSLGLIMLIIFVVAGNISNFLIEDEENKTKIRILTSGVSKWKYYVSLVFVFYIMTSLTSLIYYILCKVLCINFGMENNINFLIVLLFLNLIAISFNLCIVSFTRSRYTSQVANILILVPCCMISGVFWDFNIMSENLQRIGKFLPTRWVYICVENLQNTNNLDSINMYLKYMVLVSVVLIIISFIKLKINKEI